MQRFFVFLFILAIFNSCASGYRQIKPDKMQYNFSSNLDSIKFEYQHELLTKRYKRKENLFGVKLVAVKITNNSNKALLLDRDYCFINDNGKKLKTIPTNKTFKILRQRTASYFWYVLLSPLYLRYYKTDAYVPYYKTYPVGLVIAPISILGNITAASNANSYFNKELVQFDIQNRVIQKGETVVGLVAFYMNNYDAIKISLL